MKQLDIKYSYDIDERGIHLFRYGENCDNSINNPLISAINKIENLEKENEHLKKSQEWHDVSILPRKEGDYLCEFSIGVFNYRHFWLPDIWGIDDEKIVKWQGEL